MCKQDRKTQILTQQVQVSWCRLVSVLSKHGSRHLCEHLRGKEIIPVRTELNVLWKKLIMYETNRRKITDNILNSSTSSKYFFSDKYCFQGIPILSREYTRKTLKISLIHLLAWFQFLVCWLSLEETGMGSGLPRSSSQHKVHGASFLGVCSTPCRIRAGTVHRILGHSREVWLLSTKTLQVDWPVLTLVFQKSFVPSVDWQSWFLQCLL